MKLSIFLPVISSHHFHHPICQVFKPRPHIFAIKWNTNHQQSASFLAALPACPHQVALIDNLRLSLDSNRVASVGQSQQSNQKKLPIRRRQILPVWHVSQGSIKYDGSEWKGIVKWNYVETPLKLWTIKLLRKIFYIGLTYWCLFRETRNVLVRIDICLAHLSKLNVSWATAFTLQCPTMCNAAALAFTKVTFN